MQSLLNKGEKTKYIREAFQKLGLKAKRQEIQAWLKKTHDLQDDDVAESTFYNIRRAMLNEFAEAQEKQAARPSIATLVDRHSQAEGLPQPENNGIVALIRQLKLVVAKLGKNETKELVDVL